MQTFEKQMLSEHCTTGLNAWITPERVILIDCQPLLSASILDRSIQVDKKYCNEFNNSLEDTVEMHSLQMIGFLANVCHKLILVQDYFVDPHLIKLIQAAEMLKPSSPARVSFEDEDPAPPRGGDIPPRGVGGNKGGVGGVGARLFFGAIAALDLWAGFTPPGRWGRG